MVDSPAVGKRFILFSIKTSWGFLPQSARNVHTVEAQYEGKASSITFTVIVHTPEVVYTKKVIDSLHV